VLFVVISFFILLISNIIPFFIFYVFYFLFYIRYIIKLTKMRLKHYFAKCHLVEIMQSHERLLVCQVTHIIQLANSLNNNLVVPILHLHTRFQSAAVLE